MRMICVMHACENLQSVCLCDLHSGDWMAAMCSAFHFALRGLAVAIRNMHHFGPHKAAVEFVSCLFVLMLLVEVCC